jgi:beta-lactamase class A
VATSEYGPQLMVTPNRCACYAQGVGWAVAGSGADDGGKVTQLRGFVVSARSIACGLLLGVSIVACGLDDRQDVENVPITEVPAATATAGTGPPSPTSRETLPATSTATVATPSPEIALVAVVDAETPTTVATATVTIATPSPDPGPVYDMSAIEAAISDMTAGIEGYVAIAIAAPDGTILYELNGSESMEAASLYKLPVMVEVFRQLDAGELSSEDALLISASFFAEGADSIGFGAVDAYVGIDTLLFTMIAHSSNVAAYALLDLVGNQSVNATMSGLGLDGIEVRWSPRYIPPAEEIPETVEFVEDEVDEVEEVNDPPVTDDIDQREENVDENDLDPDRDEAPSGTEAATAVWLSVSGGDVAATIRAENAFNVVQANDLARLLAMLVNGEVVSQEASTAMVDLLAQQEIPGGLAGFLPEGSVAHKTGYLEDGVINDAGIIMTPSGPLVAVVLTEGVRDDIAYQIMAKVGLLVYDLAPE